MADGPFVRFGLSSGTAVHRLYRMVLFKILCANRLNVCHRCGREIITLKDLSLDHRSAWRDAQDPKAAFFDVDDVVFSHQGCNSGEPRKRRTHCPKGHAYVGENLMFRKDGSRICRTCRDLANNARYK